MDVSAFTALELAKNIKNRQISVREATEQVLSEMEAKEDLLHCYVYRNGEQALKRADEVQKQLDKGLLTSPLAGVPLGVKDNLCTMGIPTTCCSRMPGPLLPTPHGKPVCHRCRSIRWTLRLCTVNGLRRLKSRKLEIHRYSDDTPFRFGSGYF